MRPHHQALTFLMVSALGLYGFTCGGSAPPTPLPPNPTPSPTPSPTPTPEPFACTTLGEAACVADPRCEAQYAATETDSCACAPCPGPGICPPCECPVPPPTFVGCLDRDPCEGLDERSCLADARCEAVYVAPGCQRDCPPGDPSCGSCGTPAFAECRERHECPPVCAIWCEFGNVVDQNGCATCECNPGPTNACEGLDPTRCTSTPGCRLEGEPPPCACPACVPDGTSCPPCTCDGGGASPGDPDGRTLPAPRCIPTDFCGGLDERTCSVTPGCSPIYAGAITPCDCSGPDCACAALPFPSTYAGCIASSYGCPGLDEASCGRDPRCEPRYVTACPGNEPPPGGGGNRPAPPPECTTTFAGCFERGTPQGCQSDADCAEGFCAATPGCVDCGTVNQCVVPNCDDGQPTVCDAIRPVCGPGQVGAARNGCWACVDARSCAVPECQGAWLDQRGQCRGPADDVLPPSCCGR